MNALILGFPSVIFSHHTKALIKQWILHNLAPRKIFNPAPHSRNGAVCFCTCLYINSTNNHCDASKSEQGGLLPLFISSQSNSQKCPASTIWLFWELPGVSGSVSSTVQRKHPCITLKGRWVELSITTKWLMCVFIWWQPVVTGRQARGWPYRMRIKRFSAFYEKKGTRGWNNGIALLGEREGKSISAEIESFVKTVEAISLSL